MTITIAALIVALGSMALVFWEVRNLSPNMATVPTDPPTTEADNPLGLSPFTWELYADKEGKDQSRDGCALDQDPADRAALSAALAAEGRTGPLGPYNYRLGRY